MAAGWPGDGRVTRPFLFLGSSWCVPPWGPGQHTLVLDRTSERQMTRYPPWPDIRTMIR